MNYVENINLINFILLRESSRRRNLIFVNFKLIFSIESEDVEISTRHSKGKAAFRWH